jgi:hypothetical protein
MYYDKVLELCGYEPAEIEEQRTRLEKAFSKLKFTPEDFERAEARLIKYFDIELEGIRKMFGLYVQSLVDLVLAREEGKKLVYSMMPPMVIVQNAMAMASSEIYATAPDILLHHTHGAIFESYSGSYFRRDNSVTGSFCGERFCLRPNT